MLVVSMAIMTLSTVLSSMQVYAANYKVISNSSPSHSDYTRGATLRFRTDGEYVYDVDDGITYSYSDTDNGVIYYTMVINIPLYSYGTFYLDSKTTALLWNIKGSIWTKYLLDIDGESPNNFATFDMWIESANAIVYNKNTLLLT